MPFHPSVSDQIKPLILEVLITKYDILSFRNRQLKTVIFILEENISLGMLGFIAFQLIDILLVRGFLAIDELIQFIVADLLILAVNLAVFAKQRMKRLQLGICFLDQPYLVIALRAGRKLINVNVGSRRSDTVHTADTLHQSG